MLSFRDPPEQKVPSFCALSGRIGTDCLLLLNLMSDWVLTVLNFLGIYSQIQIPPHTAIQRLFSTFMPRLDATVPCPDATAPLEHATAAPRQPRSLPKGAHSLCSAHQLWWADLEESTLDFLCVATAPRLMKIHTERVCKGQTRLILSRGFSTMSTLICFLVARFSLG